MTTMLSPKNRQTRRARSKSMVLGRCSSPLGQEMTLKAGWLKRQRSIMRNWQLRWFVLHTEALYFYKDQDETKPQGCIILQGSQVSELSANQDEAGRHLFEIGPGGSGEKDRSGLSESFLLMAKSQSDMEEWVRAIRRAIWAPLGGGIFGQHLEETMQCESGCDSSSKPLVPLLVQQCVCFIHQHGLTEEGLFRMPGQTNHVRELQDAFNCGEKPLFGSNTDVHTVASLLKLYLRELPEPVVPFNKYTEFLSTAQLLAKNQEEGILELGRQLKSLPQVNYNLLRYICRFLDEVQSHSIQNKMSVQNLATVFGPNIFRPKMEDPQIMMEGSSQVQHLMTVLISEHSRLYQGQAETPREDQSAPPPTSYPRVHPIQRCRVEWNSQEEILPPNPAKDYPSLGQTPNTLSQEPLQPLPTSTVYSLDTDHPGLTPKERTEGDSEGMNGGRIEEKTERKRDGKSEIKLSGGRGAEPGPSKQSKSQSSWRSSLKGRSGSGGVRGKLGGSAVDVSTVTGGHWLMNGLTSFRSHRRTASTGERLKESSLCLKETHIDSLLDSYTESSLLLKDSSHSQRSTLKDSSPLHIDSSCSTIVSSYPNIKPSLSVRNSPHSNRLSTYDNVNVTPCSLSLPIGSPSPWTSCEIPLAKSTESEHSTQISGLGSGQAVAGSSMAGGSSSPLELCVSSSGWTEGDPGDDIPGQRSGVNDGLFSLVTELKEELRRQRISYETRIHKLEDSCSGLRLQSGRLEEDLGQEKKRLFMMEIRLGNSERARQEAETRNVLLQKEMEELFATLGNLTTGTDTS
ncbi:rho GTPase-activating protein 22 isoform X1 [Salmo salar]|uniref:Rho GTPase-activating protein 22 isoform X1 n=1 Tax=Salmo salar TaxID=8030 RepID=A0A1S3N370_SALSA|nr:rho GTPase-activating protein 22-like isoform X1 [Salmo salar]|eukprot:XP_014009837.1 PREDICTED: rho GTPase-activating protein 22-like isoform X1 [Salmo salar]